MRGFLPDQTHLSQVHLRSARLESALEFYSGALGLEASSGPDSQTLLSSAEGGPVVLAMTESPGAAPKTPASNGLHHFGLRYENRADLADTYRRLVDTGYAPTGAFDRGVSEAIYFHDPDGNAVELYVDRPRSQWKWKDGQPALGATPLNPEEMFGGTGRDATQAALPKPTNMGHVHLHVGDLAGAERFYSEFLGLAVTQRSPAGYLFFGAGGYHHYVGVNVAPRKAIGGSQNVGLVSYRLEVPIPDILYCLSHRAPLWGYEATIEEQAQGNPVLRIRDPNGNWLEVHAPQALLTGPTVARCQDDSRLAMQGYTGTASIHRK